MTLTEKKGRWFCGSDNWKKEYKGKRFQSKWDTTEVREKKEKKSLWARNMWAGREAIVWQEGSKRKE